MPTQSLTISLAAVWPAPLVIDSGNGAHVDYAIDLPNDPDSKTLIEKLLKALATKFDDDQATVDPTTVNPSKLAKIAGTLAAKGDSTADRPHRRSRIISQPPTLEVVSRELLEKLAAEYTPEPKAQPTSKDAAVPDYGSWLDHWLEQYSDQLPPLGPKLPWNHGGWKRVFARCPWNPEHQTSSAFIGQQLSGAIVAKCLHNSCKQENWHTLRALIEPPHAPSANGRSASAHEAQSEIRPEAEWPILSPEAMYGIAGELVKLLEPHTEADPVALLAQFLVAFGNAVGHGPHAKVEDTRHTVNLYAVFVGRTGHGRKGTSWDRVSHSLAAVDEEWFSHHLESGITSGEGVAYAVRDSDGKDDAGVADKRLMVIETEFARVLKNMGRDGSILSPMCRQAWDSGFLRTLNKKNPVKATGAHISIVGHITREELLRSFTETEMANGFGNRFLWFCVKRSKYLPEGSTVSSLISLNSRLAKALTFARKVGWMKRDQQAKDLWAEVYRGLVDVPLGLFGSLTSRGAPIVLRLSCLYAYSICLQK